MSAPTLLAARTCVRCGEGMAAGRERVPGLRVHDCRGLCERCTCVARRDGTLLDYPAATRTRAEVVEDYELLRSGGATRRQAAARMGMALESLERALFRARAAGLGVVLGPR